MLEMASMTGFFKKKNIHTTTLRTLINNNKKVTLFYLKPSFRTFRQFLRMRIVIEYIFNILNLYLLQ